MIPKLRNVPNPRPNPSPSPARTTCDFCTERNAVLYCRADTARLCLFCDQHVHSANLLSRKHHRCQICDNCSSEPASFLCSSDNLALCADCDRDAHSSSSTDRHPRVRLEGFSGCPSPSEIAAVCGIPVDKEVGGFEEGFGVESCWCGYGEGLGLQDVVVPGGGGYFGDSARGRRRKGEMGRQLEEMIRRSRRKDGPGVDEEDEKEVSVGPGTPGRAVTWQGRTGWDVGEDVLEGGQQGTFTSLLMMTCQGGGLKGGGDEGNTIPNAITSHNPASATPSTQVLLYTKFFI